MTLADAAGQLNEQYGTKIKPDALRMAIGRGKLKGKMLGPIYVVEDKEVDRYGRENLGKRGRPKKPKKEKPEEGKRGRPRGKK